MAKSKTASTSMEKLTGLIYVLFLFLITVGVSGYILFVYKSDYQFANGKKDAMEKIERIHKFQNAQSEYFEKIEKMDEYANAINPDIYASFNKNDLNYIIGELKKFSEDNKYDIRFQSFNQVATLYETKLCDKERLGVTIRNIEKIKVELDKCRTGIETLSNN